MMSRTKNAVLMILTAFLMSLFLAAGAVADDDTQAQINALKAQLADLQKKIEDLEAKQKAAPAAAPAPPPIEFHGYLRGRAYAAQAMNTTLTAEEITFQPHLTVSPDMDLDLHLWFYPSSPGTTTTTGQGTSMNYVEAAYVTFKNLPLNGKLLLGKDRNWTYGITPSGPNRLLSNSSLYSNAFHLDRVTGLQYLGKFGRKQQGEFGLALLNGYVVGTRPVGLSLIPANFASCAANPASMNCARTTTVLANREGNLNLDNNYALSGRLGGNINPEWNAGLSGYVSRISPPDITSLAAIMGGAAGADPGNRAKRQAGLDFRYKTKGLVWQGEATVARVSNLKYHGWQTQLGCNISSKNFIVAQYGALIFKKDAAGGVPSAANPASWDKYQFSLSLKRKLNKRASLQLEREWNREKVPAGAALWNLFRATAGHVPNDITFIEYFVGY